MCPPGAHLPNRVMASRHSTGVTYSLARNSCLNTSMRLESAICGRGAEFPRASARRCLTFPHSVYSTHRFSSRSFSSLRDSPGWRQAANATALSWGTADTASISLHGVTRFPTEFGFLIHRVCLLSAARFSTSARWRLKYIKYFSHFIELCNTSCVYALQRINYFHPGANAVLSHGSRDS